MKYSFNKKELNTLSGLNIPFDVTADLTDDQEIYLLELLMRGSGFGTAESDALEDVYQTMAEQAG